MGLFSTHKIDNYIDRFNIIVNVIDFRLVGWALRIYQKCLYEAYHVNET